MPKCRLRPFERRIGIASLFRAFHKTVHAPPHSRHRSPRGACATTSSERAARRATPRSGRSSRPTPTATASSASSRACAVPMALPCSIWPKPSACALWAGAARSCCSKACSRRVTWSCARASTCGTRCTATRRSTCWQLTRRTLPHRVFLKMNSGMNRLGFTPERLSRRLDPPERAAAGRRDFADDPLQRRRRAARDRSPDAAFEQASARPARRPLAGQQRGHPAPCRTKRGRRLGSAGHRVVWQRARLPGARCRALAICSPP